MKFSKHFCRTLFVGACLTGCLGSAQATDAPLPWYFPESAGARTGASFTSRAHDFHQIDVFANWNLPWKWDLGARLELESQAAYSAGCLWDQGTDGVVLTLGPCLVLRREGWPVSLAAGSSPTYLARQHYISKDFSCEFQFTSYIGLNCDLSRHVRLGYRFQHMSNAGIEQPNPGLNLHVLGISYLF